jgi:hypothetical protein
MAKSKQPLAFGAPISGEGLRDICNQSSNSIGQLGEYAIKLWEITMTQSTALESMHLDFDVRF